MAALEGMLTLRELLGEEVEIRVFAPRTEFLYRPLAVTEPFGTGELLRFDLSDLAERCGASFQADSIVAVDEGDRRVTTHDGEEIHFDALLLASGAKSLWSVPGSITFWGVSDDGGVPEIVGRLEAGDFRRVAFTMPGAHGWPLPIYELALQTAARLESADIENAELLIVTPEEAPLQLFGVHASDQVRALLEGHGIEVRCNTHPVKFEDGSLEVVPSDQVEVDAVVSVPRLEGRRIEGVPHDSDGYAPTDEHGLVRGMDRVFAAGDGTDFPVKQGGLATQQADAAAESIAALLGAGLEPAPFEPILRGKLLTGEEPRFLSGTPTGGHGDDSVMSRSPLWEIPGKVVGRRLGPFLASIADIDLGVPDDEQPGTPLGEIPPDAA